MSHRYLYFVLSAGVAISVLTGCKKDKENSAVVEEVPAVAPPAETDTSATLAEEPNLKQVGKDKPGSVKGTFHPSGKGSAPSAAASEAGFSDAGRFVVQVAIFKSKRQAASLVEKLSGQGYPAYVAEVENPVPELAGTYHRVRIGKFARIADAKAFGENTLKPLGYDFWVDNKKNDGVGGTGEGYSAPAAEPAAAPSGDAAGTEAPAPRKGKKSKAVAAEPAAPPSGTWGEPKAEETAAPSGDSWSAPTTEKAPASKSQSAPELPGTNSAPSAAASSAPAEPAQPAKADSGKVNLDEW